MLRRLCLAFARCLVSSLALGLTASICTAICLATCCLQMTALLGTSLPATLAMLAALALGFAAGAGPARWLARLKVPGITAGALLHFALAAWIVCSPSIVQLVDSVISRPGAIVLDAPARNAGVLFALCLAALGVPAFIAAKLVADPDADPDNGGPAARRSPASAFFGVSVGLAVWELGLAQIAGPYYLALVAAGVGLTAAAARGWRMAAAAGDQAADPLPSEADALRPAPGLDSTLPHARQPISTESETIPPFPAMCRIVVDGGLAVGLGGAFAAITRLLEQLLPASVYLCCSEAIGICLGIAAGIFVFSRRSKSIIRLERARLTAAGLVSVGLAGLVAAFPLLVELCLWLNAYVSSTLWLLAARGTLVAVAVAPLGTAAATWMAPAEAERDQGVRLKLPSWLVLGVVGYSAVASWALRQFALELVLVALAWGTAVAAAPIALRRPTALFAGWLRKAAALAIAAVVLVAPAWQHNFDPQQSAKLLFNSSAAYGYRSGLTAASLIGIDNGRHLATVGGQGGIYTVWRFGGYELQIRENGVPCGVVSTDSEVFPRFLPETMQSALPLALHGHVNRMLLLGLGSSEGLSAALAFPLPEIVCLEADAGLVRVVRNIVARDLGACPLDDERVALAICEPALGLTGTQGRFEVIVSSPPNVGLAAAQPYFTAEFYRRAAAKLSDDGIFCQRLQHIDLGPRPIADIARTVQSVFRDVLAVQVAPGEMLLAASNGSQGVIRPELTTRFELPHVRRLLSESGLDWTVALNLGALDDSGLKKFTADSSRPANSAATGRLPLSLPREVMRWGPKQEELAAATAKKTGRILAWIGAEGEAPVLIRRLAEVQGQLDLMTKHSDQYWAYRASLRNQVKEKSRSKIQQVSASIEERRPLHPEDLRRLQYFTALGEATRTHQAADIDRLLKFAVPYDPLISYFVRQEAAEIYSRSPERDCAKELRHRLYATFYSSPRDASLRNVVEALKLLREHPECEPDAALRWDVFNSLLQALKMRWDARSGVPPTNAREALADVDATVLAVEQTLRAMQPLTAAAGLPESLWTARGTVIEKLLIRPVKQYEIDLLPHVHRKPPEGREAQRKDRGSSGE